MFHSAVSPSINSVSTGAQSHKHYKHRENKGDVEANVDDVSDCIIEADGTDSAAACVEEITVFLGIRSLT
jgi:hypothetical protein